MKVKDLIKKLQAFNPEAEVFQMYYGGRVKPIMVLPADEHELEDINFSLSNTRPPNQPIDELKPLDFAVVFWAG